MNEQILDWLFTCPAIKPSDTSFQTMEVDNLKKSVQTVGVTNYQEDIGGNQIGQHQFGIISFVSAGLKPIGRAENIADYETISAINKWLIEQNKAQNYPELTGYKVTNLTLGAVPQFSGIDTTDKPLAKYQIVFTIDFEAM